MTSDKCDRSMVVNSELGLWFVGDKKGHIKYIKEIEQMKNGTSISINSSERDQNYIPTSHYPQDIGIIKRHNGSILSMICRRGHLITSSIDNEIILFPKTHLIKHAKSNNIDLTIDITDQEYI